MPWKAIRARAAVGQGVDRLAPRLRLRLRAGGAAVGEAAEFAKGERPLRQGLDEAQLERGQDRIEIGIVGVHLHNHAVEEPQAEAIHVLEGALAVKHVAEEVEHVAVPRAVKRWTRRHRVLVAPVAHVQQLEQHFEQCSARM